MKKIWTILCATLLFTGCYDDGDLWNSIDDLDKKLEELRQTVNTTNSDLSSLTTIVYNLNGGKTVTSIVETATGYTIAFSDQSSITVAKGESVEAIPVIGIDTDNGVYYWTVTTDGATDWLKDAAGNKMPVSGATPVMGVDADGNWTVDTGSGPENILDGTGHPVPAGGVVFRSITESDGVVTFTLADGTTISIPKTGSLSLSFSGASTQYFYFDETRTFTLTVSKNAQITVSKPDGWRVKAENGQLTITAPAEGNAYAETEGEISIIAVGESTAVLKIAVEASAYDAPVVLTFENVPADQLAGPTFYGENLYSSYAGDYFSSYTDPVTNLTLSIPYDFGMAYYDGFSMGGAAVSRWNDTETASYANQCSAYYSDPTTGKGGNNGSETFSIVYVPTFMGPDYPVYVEFENAEEAVIDHLYVSNSTYAALSMLNGDAFAKKFSYADKDYLRLTFHGYDADGNKAGSVEYYLSDFRTVDAPGVLLGWHKVDLAALGKINRVVFVMDSSDGTGNFVNTPTYFCIDDIAIRP